MSDCFEKAMQGIATRSAKNGGPTIADVLTALVAENDDAEDRHRETKLALKELAADGITCDSRISLLEKWRAGNGPGDDHHTAAQTAQLVANTAQKTARELAASEEEGDIRRAWRIGKWFVLGAGIVLINQVGNMWFGK